MTASRSPQGKATGKDWFSRAEPFQVPKESHRILVLDDPDRANARVTCWGTLPSPKLSVRRFRNAVMLKGAPGGWTVVRVQPEKVAPTPVSLVAEHRGLVVGVVVGAHDTTVCVLNWERALIDNVVKLWVCVDDRKRIPEFCILLRVCPFGGRSMSCMVSLWRLFADAPALGAARLSMLATVAWLDHKRLHTMHAAYPT